MRITIRLAGVIVALIAFLLDIFAVNVIPRTLLPIVRLELPLVPVQLAMMWIMTHLREEKPNLHQFIHYSPRRVISHYSIQTARRGTKV